MRMCTPTPRVAGGGGNATSYLWRTGLGGSSRGACFLAVLSIFVWRLVSRVLELQDKRHRGQAGVAG